MFDRYIHRMEKLGGSIRGANYQQSVQIMEHSFKDSQSFRLVTVEGIEREARIITDSKTTVRGGSGNFIIQFRDGYYPPAGTYVTIPDYDGNEEIWLILYESDATLFPKHIIKKCNYLLKWKNYKGDIVERWCVFSDNARLMDAERKTYYNKMTLSYYSTPLILPCDEETININIDKRFLVDHEQKLDNPDAWIVTNRNVISKRFDTFNGVIEIMLSRHQFNKETDNAELMIANYYDDYDVVEEATQEKIYDCRISYSGNSDLKMNTPYKRYIAEFYEDGILNEYIQAEWELLTIEDDIDHYTWEIDGNTFRIKCAFDTALIGTSIRLVARNKEFGCSAELPIKVVSSI